MGNLGTTSMVLSKDNTEVHRGTKSKQRKLDPLEVFTFNWRIRKEAQGNGKIVVVDWHGKANSSRVEGKVHKNFGKIDPPFEVIIGKKVATATWIILVDIDWINYPVEVENVVVVRINSIVDNWSCTAVSIVVVNDVELDSNVVPVLPEDSQVHGALIELRGSIPEVDTLQMDVIDTTVAVKVKRTVRVLDGTFIVDLFRIEGIIYDHIVVWVDVELQQNIDAQTFAVFVDFLQRKVEKN